MRFSVFHLSVAQFLECQNVVVQNVFDLISPSPMHILKFINYFNKIYFSENFIIYLKIS